jgi:simple sugar transport system permease protein
MGETTTERRSFLALLTATLLVAVVLAFAAPSFLTPANLLDLLTTASFTGVLALGLLVVLLAGGLDISFTAIATIAQLAIAALLARVDLGWIGSILFVLLVGGVLGLFNGWLVSRLKTAPIIVTIALLNIYFGVAILVSKGEMIYDFPEFFWEGTLWRDGPLRFTIQLAAFLVVAAVTALILSGVAWGRVLRAAGGNADALARQGISLLRVNLFAYGWLGALAGLAGLCQAQLVQAVTPGALVGKELDVVAAVVLGGATLTGGRGTVAGTVLGVLLLALLLNGMVLTGLSPYWHQVTTGFIVLASLLLARLRRRRAGIIRPEGDAS